jgi:hypothetical protein
MWPKEQACDAAECHQGTKPYGERAPSEIYLDATFAERAVASALALLRLPWLRQKRYASAAVGTCGIKRVFHNV